MSSTGNNGKCRDLMFQVPNISKTQITGGALDELDKLFSLLNMNTKAYLNKRKKSGVKRNKTKKDDGLLKEITVKQLSTVLKWGYTTIYTKSFLKEFKGIVFEKKNTKSVKVEKVPKFCEVLYRVMGEPA